jgi:hypothetical protein
MGMMGAMGIMGVMGAVGVSCGQGLSEESLIAAFIYYARGLQVFV